MGGEIQYRGGCLCGALRYEADGDPIYAGLCYCADCRKASGAGFIPFLGFPANAVRLCGDSVVRRSLTASGRQAARNFCARCGSLVFGGVRGEDDKHTVYAGSLDDPTLFQPKVAIFAQGRPDWATIPPGLKVFERGPA